MYDYLIIPVVSINIVVNIFVLYKPNILDQFVYSNMSLK